MFAWERRGSGFPIVLVHGFFGNRSYWNDLAGDLVANHEVITLDLPGLGESAAIDPPAQIAGYAEMLRDHLASLGIPRFILLGHSLGSMVAQEFAVRHQEMLAGLVLYGSTTSGGGGARHETFDASIERVRSSGIAATAVKICSAWFHRPPAPHILQGLLDGTRAVRVEAAVQLLEMVRDWRSPGNLHEVRARTLVACGDKDRSTGPTQSVALWQALPNADLMMLPLCGHAAHQEAPAEFSAGLRRFISDLDLA